MTTLQTADGRLLKAQRPAGASFSSGNVFSGQAFPPMWSDGERWGDSGYLKSFEQIYRSQPVVAGVVDKLSRRIATLPFDAYRRLENQAREVVTGDTLDSLLRHPMPRCGTVHLNHHIAQSLLIHGNALVAKVRGTDREAPPVMLWPLDWAKVNAYGDGTIEWWSTTQYGDTERFIAADDVMHFAWPGPDGGPIGVSPLEKLAVTIRLEDAIQRSQVATMKNGSRPSLAVTVDKENAKTEQLEYVRQRVEAMHKGVDNAGKTFFMGSNVKVQPLSLSPVEVALIDQRRLSREEVGAVYDLSGPLMNDLTHSSFANVTELLRSLYRDVLPPWLALIQTTYQAQLLDPEPAWLDRFTEFDLTDKLKGDPVELATSLKLQVEAGLLTRNEARRILNLPPIGDSTDDANPANQLTANVNNQGALSSMDTPPA
jgi:HK97 family phage portal protein